MIFEPEPESFGIKLKLRLLAPVEEPSTHAEQVSPAEIDPPILSVDRDLRIGVFVAA